MEKLILIGGGGHCRSCIEVIESTGEFEIAGILDKSGGGEAISGYPVIGNDDRIEEFAGRGYAFLVTVGQLKSGRVRKDLFEKVKKGKGKLVTVIASTAYVSKHAVAGEGTVIMHGALVNAGARIGANCIVNSKAIVEHDSIMGDHCHLSTGSIVNGDCRVGEGSFIGSAAVLRHGISIAAQTIVGAGAVVVKDTESGGIYAGNPAVLIHK